MENEVVLPHGRLPTDAPASSYTARAPSGAATPALIDPERNGVFTSLVREDSDISGLVAYSIYKQNKLDWLQAFEAAKGRAPDEAEVAAYIIGESTPRRLATYRHLAESTLAGKGPDVDGTPARYGAGKTVRAPGMLTPGLIATYLALAVLFVVAFWLAAHYTVSTH